MFFQGKELRYGLDKVEFITKRSFGEVKPQIDALRPIQKKMGEIDAFPINSEQNRNSTNRHEYKIAGEVGYKTIIRFTKISPDIFDLIKGNEIIFGKPWLVEIFQDILCDSEDEATALANRLIQYSNLKYCNDPVWFLYDRKKIRSQTKKKPPKNITEKKYDDYLWSTYIKQRKLINYDIIGDQTLYLTKGLCHNKDLLNYKITQINTNEHNFKYIIYARLSKKDKKPVVHHEFRLKGWNLLDKLDVRKKTGTSYFQTLKNLTGSQGAATFKKLYGKSIILHKINELKLSKHLLGWSNRKKLSKAEQRKINTYTKGLKRTWGLDITASYMKYFKRNNLDYRLFIEKVS